MGATLGLNLITQGVGDLVDVVWSSVAGEAVDWASYWTKKGISSLMMVVGAAAKSIAKATYYRHRAFKEVSS